MKLPQLQQDYNYLLQRSIEIETLRTTLEKHLSKVGSERANE